MAEFDKLPIEARLKIFGYLASKKELLQCRLISKTFLPSKLVLGLIIISNTPDPVNELVDDWNSAISEYRATLALDLTSLLKSPAESLPNFQGCGGYTQRPDGKLDFRLDFLPIHDSFILRDRILQKLEDFPAFLLANLEILLVVGNGAGVVQDLDRILANNCPRLRKLAMIQTTPRILKKITEIHAKYGASLKDIAYSDTFNNGIAIECGILQKSSAEVILLERGGDDMDINVKLLPGCISCLMLQTPVGIPDLEEMTQRLWNLQKLSLCIEETKSIEVRKFCVQHLQNLGNLPRLTELTLKFEANHDKGGLPGGCGTTLEQRLKAIVSHCRERDGVFAEMDTKVVKLFKNTASRITIRIFIDRRT